MLILKPGMEGTIVTSFGLFLFVLVKFYYSQFNSVYLCTAPPEVISEHCTKTFKK